MTDEQFSKLFDMLTQKLDWIGGELESLRERINDITNYPRDVRIVESTR